MADKTLSSRNLQADETQKRMFQQAGRDVELEKMISQKKYKNILMAVVATSAVYTPLILITFFLSGFYVSFSEVYFHGFGNVHWFAFLGGIFIGGFPIIFCNKTYIHPDTEIKGYKIKDEGITDLVVSDGERVIRGSRISQGAPSQVISKAVADAKKLAETTKKYLKDKDPKRLSLVEKLYPEYVPPTLLAETPFPYSIENRALFFIGSAGSGKSQGIKELIFNVWNRKCRDKFVVYDRKPEYLTMMFRNGDKIICPADLRHTSWDMFAEIEGEQGLDGVIASLIPPATGEKANDKFWVDSSRNVFKAILVYLMEHQREMCEDWDRQHSRYLQGKEFVQFKLREVTHLRGAVYKVEGLMDQGTDENSNSDFKNYYDSVIKGAESANWTKLTGWVRRTLTAAKENVKKRMQENDEVFDYKEGEHNPAVEKEIETLIMAAISQGDKTVDSAYVTGRMVVNLRYTYKQGDGKEVPVRPYEKPSNEDLVKFMSVTVSDPNYLWICMKKRGCNIVSVS